MKLTKNDNRKEMSDVQANLFAVGGIGAMLLIAGLSVPVTVGIGGMFLCGLWAIENNKNK